MTTDCGEVTGGVCSTINNTRKYLFLKRWRIRMMAHHDLLFLTDESKQVINIHVKTYENYNTYNGKTAYDVPTILSIIFQTMRPNVRVNIFNKIGTMKDVTLSSCNNNIFEWVSKMEMKRINIEIKIPGDYDDDQFLLDVYAGALLAK